MKKSLLLFILLISLVTEKVFAQEINSARFENVVKTLKLNKEKIKTEFCMEKKMPNAEDSYIILLPILPQKEEVDYFTVQNYILITDKQGNIKNQYFDPTEIISDAIGLSGFTIDTGLYTINENIRAFGIKARFIGQSKPNPYSSEDISLYYPSGKTLKKVLSQFNLNSSRGEWDTRCAGEFEDEDSMIIMDKQKTNNFTNLTIKTKIIQRKNKEIKGDCKEFETSKTTYKTLKFSNGKYQ